MEDKESYWKIVCECLIQLHGWDKDRAKESVDGTWEHLKKDLTEEEEDFLYHEEPFWLACEIAENELSFEDHKDKYNLILEQEEVAEE